MRNLRLRFRIVAVAVAATTVMPNASAAVTRGETTLEGLGAPAAAGLFEIRRGHRHAMLGVMASRGALLADGSPAAEPSRVRLMICRKTCEFRNGLSPDVSIDQDGVVTSSAHVPGFGPLVIRWTPAGPPTLGPTGYGCGGLIEPDSSRWVEMWLEASPASVDPAVARGTVGPWRIRRAWCSETVAGSSFAAHLSFQN